MGQVKTQEKFLLKLFGITSLLLSIKIAGYVFVGLYFVPAAFMLLGILLIIRSRK
ncbi:hypothetical protein BMS3Abin16_00983 [archaeon BMS3Abin16]|nr:hypothetical protein BMS3Abin16_00983 [archaeon BMS3Abin16]